MGSAPPIACCRCSGPLLAHLLSASEPGEWVCLWGWTRRGSGVGAGCNFRQRLTPKLSLHRICLRGNVASHRLRLTLHIVHARGPDETTRIYHSCKQCGRLLTGYTGRAAVDAWEAFSYCYTSRLCPCFA